MKANIGIWGRRKGNLNGSVAVESTLAFANSMPENKPNAFWLDNGGVLGVKRCDVCVFFESLQYVRKVDRRITHSQEFPKIHRDVGSFEKKSM
jgi:hypothetical protein